VAASGNAAGGGVVEVVVVDVAAVVVVVDVAAVVEVVVGEVVVVVVVVGVVVGGAADPETTIENLIVPNIGLPSSIRTARTVTVVAVTRPDTTERVNGVASAGMTGVSCTASGITPRSCRTVQ
jgi:hypothetical protein